MIRLCNSYGFNYVLKDTETQNYLGGCAVVPQWYNGAEVNVIWSVMIYGEFRQKGFATTMLKRIIKKFRNSKKSLLLHVYKNNEIALHLYKKLGFEIIGEYLSGEAWTMQYKPER